MSRITFTDPADCFHFCVGDRLSGDGSEIVTGVHPERCEITTARATWYRRLRYWCRAQVKHAWWWIRCTWADLWEKGE